MDRRYSLRTCLLIVVGGVVASWAVVLGIGWLIWAMMPGAGGIGLSADRDLPPKKYWADECTVTVKITDANRARFLCKLMKANDGARACGTINGDFMVVPNFGTANMTLAEYGIVFVHEPAHNCKGWAAEHPR